MKTDERLNVLCKEFADLDEDEKDYILGVSQVLVYSITGNTTPPPVVGLYEADSRNAQVQLRSI